MQPIDLPSPRITLIDLPAIDSSVTDTLTIRAELDVVPSEDWLEGFRVALISGSELLVQAAPHYVGGAIEFESLSSHARELCDELRGLVEMTTRQHSHNPAPSPILEAEPSYGLTPPSPGFTSQPPSDGVG